MSAHNMIKYLNHQTEENVQTKLIHFIFNHYHTLQHMTIIELAQRCYVSTASVSRFARNFGYHSFDDMKNSIATEMTISEPYVTYRMTKQSLKELSSHPDEFYRLFADGIITSIKDTVNTLPFEAIDMLLHRILQTDDVILFGYDIMIDELRIFQSALLSCGIIVRLGETPDVQLELAKHLTSHSTAIVFSSFGTFFAKLPTVYSHIAQSNAHLILVTQMPGSNIYTGVFDEVLPISSKTNVEAGSYPMNFLLDYMARRIFVLQR
ncbi:MAG: hypothetical protein ABF470_07210 [Liquorilactobacillus sp.]|uniref:MurR/RpiR family transcriptional regulator n=1 Tax=Liquorilactobacillus TaxID=2767888 RepID=UPI0039EAFA75